MDRHVRAVEDRMPTKTIANARLIAKAPKLLDQLRALWVMP